MNDIFREVDEALHQEKVEKFWHDNKEIIIASILTFIIGVAVITFYKSWDIKRDGEETGRLLTILEEGEEGDLSSVTDGSRGGVETIANFIAAGRALDNDKLDEAVKAYESIANKGNAPRAMEDLARILSAENNPSASLDILKPVLADEKSPWIWHARLQAAGMVAEKNNNYTEALKYLEPFEEATGLSPTLKQRALAMAHIYKMKQSGTAQAPAQIEPAAAQSNNENKDDSSNE